MTLVQQTISHFIHQGLGRYDQSQVYSAWVPAANLVWGDADWSPDDTVFPGFTGSVIPGCTTPAAADSAFRACNYMFAVETQATPDNDSTVDIFFSGGFSAPFTVGELTSVWASMRSPDGDTIYAQWYKGGDAYGSQVSFDNTFHALIRLPDFIYDVGDMIAGLSLTLRIWGGTAHYWSAFFVPRVTLVADAQDYIDPAATAPTVASDPISPTGTVVQPNGTAGKMLRFDDPLPILEEPAYVFGTWRTNTVSNDVVYGSFRSSVTPPGFVNDATSSRIVWNGDVNAFGAGVVPKWTSVGTRFSSYWTGYQGRQDLTYSADNNTWDSVSTKPIFQPGDFVELWSAQSGVSYDQVIWARRVQSMSLSPFPGSSSYNRGATFNLDWSYLGYTAWNTSPTDVSSLFTSVDGVVFDSSGNIIYTETGIGDPWTVDTGLFSPGNGLTAIVRGNLDDGSYAYVGWLFDSIGPSFVPGIYRRL